MNRLLNRPYNKEEIKREIEFDPMKMKTQPVKICGRLLTKVVLRNVYHETPIIEKKNGLKYMISTSTINWGKKSKLNPK